MSARARPRAQQQPNSRRAGQIPRPLSLWILLRPRTGAPGRVPSRGVPRVIIDGLPSVDAITHLPLVVTVTISRATPQPNGALTRLRTQTIKMLTCKELTPRPLQKRARLQINASSSPSRPKTALAAPKKRTDRKKEPFLGPYGRKTGGPRFKKTTFFRVFSFFWDVQPWKTLRRRMFRGFAPFPKNRA